MPFEAEYLPTWQSWQSKSFVAWTFLLHLPEGHDVHLAFPFSSWYFPASHGTQALVLSESLMNVPKAHCLHSLPLVSFWYEPGLQEEQKAELVLFLVENPDGRLTHVSGGLGRKEVKRNVRKTLWQECYLFFFVSEKKRRKKNKNQKIKRLPSPEFSWNWPATQTWQVVLKEPRFIFQPVGQISHNVVLGGLV